MSHALPEAAFAGRRLIYGNVHAQVVAAPTGSGKTGILELAILGMMSKDVQGEQLVPHPQRQLKAVYLAPSKALVQVSTKLPPSCFLKSGLAPLQKEMHLVAHILHGAEPLTTHCVALCAP